MTHDELMENIKTGYEFAGIKYAPDSHTFALRAVVEIHKPKDYKVRGTFADGLIQTGCACGGWSYPCPTIQVIEKELG